MNYNSTSLTRKQILLIRELVRQGANQTKLAKDYGVSRSTINRIINNRSFKETDNETLWSHKNRELT